MALTAYILDHFHFLITLSLQIILKTSGNCYLIPEIIHQFSLFVWSFFSNKSSNWFFEGRGGAYVGVEKIARFSFGCYSRAELICLVNCGFKINKSHNCWYKWLFIHSFSCIHKHIHTYTHTHTVITSIIIIPFTVKRENPMRSNMKGCWEERNCGGKTGINLLNF